MRRQATLTTYLSPILLLAFLAGCGGDFTASSSVPPEESSSFQDDGQNDDRETGEWMLSPVDGNTFSTPKRQGAELKVELVTANGETRSGETVRFALGNGEADADLGSRRVSTDEAGVAAVQFRAGSTLNTYTVVASHPEAEDLELHVEVVPLPKGNLAVTVSDANTDPVSLETIQIRMYPKAELTCDQFDGLDDPAGATYSRRIPSASDAANFEKLAPNSEWTAVAHGYGASGKALAAGCQGAVSVDPGATKDVTVPLELLRLDPEGTYQVTSHWDLTSTVNVEVPGGDMVTKIVDIVAEPVGGIFDKISDFVEDKTNSIVAAIVEHSDTAKTIKNEIDKRIENNGVLTNLRAAGRGLKEAINNLEVHSELQVDQAANDGSLTGTHTWKTAYVYYRAECGNKADPSCGRRELTLQSDQEGGLSDEFQGSVESFNQLKVGEHTIRVDVGHILVETLEKLIIPEMTDGAASTLEGAVKHWFDCEGMAQDLKDDGTLCVAGRCLAKSTVANACNSSISWAVDTDDFIQNLLNHKATITMKGPGTLAVPNDRGVIETIDEGTFDATVQKVGQTATSSVQADWSAKNMSVVDSDDGNRGN